ncbi:hypothetical protein AKJ53_01725 [candidate division MSBL1 archaeon SCGC-AAA382F02]|uniref:Uncharacterized protein n=1 Tax=candidate division MSBL1 archaeon SCGC-AAA382F02 TaxID=1698282 RepID=A0A133VHM9_9EURY|nr:hypothetical protein AKJ53_01725 [candidate division MSBL1 archaeon SCGC-AAA382F02]
MKKRITLAIAICLILTTPTLTYQLQGQVTNQNGDTTPNLDLELNLNGTGYTTTTDSNGQYQLGNQNDTNLLENATYDVTITGSNIDTYNTTATVNGETTKDFQVQENIQTYAPFHQEKWIYNTDKVSVKTEGVEYILIMNKIDTTVEFDVYEQGNKIQQARLSENQTTHLTELNITVLETYTTSSRANLLFESTNTDTQITIGDQGTVNVYPAQKNFLLKSLDERQITITYTNNYDTEVTINGIDLSTITEGFTLQSTTGTTLKPGEEATATLTINPVKLTVGEHTQKVKFTHTARDKKRTVNSVIQVKISDSTMQQGLQEETNTLNITAPDTTLPGEWVTIKINGVTEKDAITVTDPIQGMEIDPSTKQVAHGTWSAKFKFNEPGNHNIPFGYYGTYFTSHKIQVTSLNQTNFNYNPTFQPGKNITITPKLKEEKLTDAEITVNGNNTNKVTPEPGETYEICVRYHGNKHCEDKQAGKKQLTVTGISTITPGDKITPRDITVENTETDETITNYTLTVNNIPIDSQGTTLEQGKANTVTVKAEGYKPYRTTIGQETKATGGFLNLPEISPIHIAALAIIAAAGYLLYRKSQKPPPGGYQTPERNQESMGWASNPQGQRSSGIRKETKEGEAG